MSYLLTFLGTGTSHGIPAIGCSCPTCLSTNAKDKRYRSSILLQKDNNNIVIDTGPEFRLQTLRAGFTHLDAVLYTHSHADHLNGIDDLRTFTVHKSLPIYANKETVRDIENRFPYVLAPKDTVSSIPHLYTNVLIEYEKYNIGGFEITPIPIYHGDMRILGYRIFNMAYLTDCNKIPQKSLEYLKNLDLLVIVALQHRVHKTHFNLQQAIEISNKIGAKKTLFTHIAHGLNHGIDNEKLPENMRMAYDTLQIELKEN